MRYVHSLIPEDEPIIRDMPVYDAASLANGELLMLGTTDPDSSADCGISLITAAVASSAEAVDAVGILTESTYASTVPSNVYSSTAAGAYYGKVILNPFAIYRAEYKQDTSNDLAITSTSTTTLTIGSLEDDIDGGWAFFPLTATGVKNSLRFITASASGSCTMDSALLTTGNSSDTIIKILPQNHRLVRLDSTATGLTTTAAVSDGVSLQIVENYISSDGHATQPLRKSIHKGLNNLSNAKFYADLVMLDHMYNNA